MRNCTARDREPADRTHDPERVPEAIARLFETTDRHAFAALTGTFRAQTTVLLRRISAALQDKASDRLPPIRVFPHDDHVAIEWLAASCRFGFNIEADATASGWFYVANRTAACGLLRDADIPALVRAFQLTVAGDSRSGASND